MIPVYFVVSEHRGTFQIELIRPTQESAEVQATRISRQHPDLDVHVLRSVSSHKKGERV